MRRALTGFFLLALIMLRSPGRVAAGDAPAADAGAAASDASTAAAGDAPTALEPASNAIGTVTGHLLDAGTREGLPAATIQVLGGPTAIAEIDGTFTLTLAPGTYTLLFSTPEYVEQRRTVTIAPSQSLAVELALASVPRTGTAETIEVEGALDTRKDSAVLAERRASAAVSDAVSAQQIARSPDSNASDAAKRIVAATIQDNRYLVVRGLGGRYSTTLLNGVPLPSPDPDMPAAPLDLFPASLVTNLTINKTFLPDMPGNVAGGALGIETRSYPTKFLFRARIGIAGNTASSFRTVNGQRGGSLDFFGYDDGGRSLPGAIPTDRPAGDASLSQQEIDAQTAAFRSNWSIKRGMAGPNLGLGATIGDSLRVSDHRLGYFGSVSFGHGYSRRVNHIQGVGEDDPAGGKRPSTLQLDDVQGIEQANLGALGSIGWSPAAHHKLDLFTMYAHGADIATSDVSGTEASTATVDRSRLQFVQRELWFSQLVGNHRLADAVTLEWQGNVARVMQHEPDTRDLGRSPTGDGRMVINTTPGSSERVFSELTDDSFGGSLAVRVPLELAKIKAGASIQRSARDYQARRFHFTLAGDAPFQNPDQAFDPSKAGGEMTMYEATLPSDGYDASRTIAGAYAMADVNLTSQLRLVGGARIERSSLDVGLASKIDLMAPPMPRTRSDDSDLLPSLNAIYAITPSMNLRAAYATTVARANFRELSPSLYFDYVRRRVLGGNPGLEETHIQNGDLRWELFLGDSEVIAASAFAKHFTRPIERTVTGGGSGDNVSFANADRANSYGIELEARLSLARIAPKLSAFSLAGNLALIGSRIDIEGGGARPLQGQSPYVANLGLGYDDRSFGTRVDVAYNVFGRRIDEVGVGGGGSIYEEPFHRLDLTISQSLPRNLRVKLAASNLLNQRVVHSQSDVEIYAYQVGVTVLGSVEYSLE
jgi:outer membrane receptor protein involved in Fe transport